ncbi:MAG TPA: flagellar basal body-associated FliL family protein [Candidatus Didemnitutus sp.]|nr:flagellar basal body-associated FliL family protein [Candidatus Didemnitutus sp.]
MAAKSEAKEAKEAAPAEKPAGAPAEGAASAPAGGSALKAFLPAIIAIVLAPAASFAVSEFVLLPRIQKKLAAQAALPPGAPAAAEAAPAAADGGEKSEKGKEGKDGKDGKENVSTYEFNNVVVNLAGTMGTRYLKTSFVVTAAEKGANIKSQFEGQKARFTDITLSVLSSLTLTDLEEAGAKNVLREKLTAAYNQGFGKRVVDQVYFSDFVVQ